MKATPSKTRKASEKKPAGDASIARYGAAQTAQHAAICDCLRKELEVALPKARAKIWHAIPVWFIDDKPVVGYYARPKQVTLLFWNGQSFEEPALEAVGKFKAAQIQFTDVSQIDAKAVRRWLKKARTDIWDLKEIRKRK